MAAVYWFGIPVLIWYGFWWATTGWQMKRDIKRARKIDHVPEEWL